MSRLLVAAFLFLFCSLIRLQAQDKFADIGTRQYQTREHLLTVPQPPELPDITLSVTHDPNAVFMRKEAISTSKELYAELEKLREQFTPFMQDLAPEMENLRIHVPIEEMSWRIENENDRKDFLSTLQGKGSWEKVSIPHYGAPLGRAVTYYFKKINLDQKMIDKGSLFLCFKGVDYKAAVFFNGNLCGEHEGFFAPFEFNISTLAKSGENTILVKVENDYTTTGGEDDKGNNIVGDKIYGATGPGYDNPQTGWHHCPAGMGIYQDCYIEARSPLHINDLYVRPILKDSIAEAWVEINNFEQYPEEVTLKLSIYGQNFEETVVKDIDYIPSTTYIPGVGDLAKPSDWQKEKLKMGYGVNYLKIPVKMKDFRLWDTRQPWLYQLQVKLYNSNGDLLDTQTQQFGMRSFEMDIVSIPKGKMYLNGEMIRLRGANTMGHMQQCVIRKDWKQLRDDILLARLCNMNYLRLTQRPVQPEIYEYMDKLGMLNQTDLPLFGGLRRNQFAEVVKQAEEMERLVRIHPSTIMVSYINERFPNAEGHPQRSFSDINEYYRLFKALDQAVLLNNPDRVIKAGDGDYDPPSPGLPDSHCYNTWYNGHGLGLGEMYKGYWQPVKPDWLYGCGEFGAEGLDPVNVMKKYYPKEWLPKDKEDEQNWTANRIVRAQTHRFHYMWYNTQHSLEDWVEASQDYQAWAVKFATETFKRDSRMVSFAVHLFIDAWPSGWMKTIMDVDRQPKKAYFAYRNALEPLMVSVRSDRSKFFSGEESGFEIWLCNDLNISPKNYLIKYQIENNGKVVFANQTNAEIPINSSRFQGVIKYKLPKVSKRTNYTLRIALFNEKGESVSQNHFDFEVFTIPKAINQSAFIIGDIDGKAAAICKESGIETTTNWKDATVILVDDFSKYSAIQTELIAEVEKGKKIIFLELPSGTYNVAGSDVTVDKTNMGNYYFVSPETDHPRVKNFEPFDFRFWYDSEKEIISPILSYTFTGDNWVPILISGASNWLADKGTVMAVGEMKKGKGSLIICEVDLLNKIGVNPAAREFVKVLFTGK